MATRAVHTFKVLSYSGMNPVERLHMLRPNSRVRFQRKSKQYADNDFSRSPFMFASENHAFPGKLLSFVECVPNVALPSPEVCSNRF
jgi:hypothetical protein